jgi:Tfp pilus assembly protein PilF
MSTGLSPLHNPALLPGETLLAEFTARRTLLTKILEIIRGNQPGHPTQNLLLIGPRGMGKSTLLWAIAHSIHLEDKELREKWQPVVFDEESRRIGDLADFWLECISQWEVATGNQAANADALLDSQALDMEHAAREKFLQLLDTQTRRVVLLVDNIDAIFSNLNDTEAEHRLRAFLMENDRIMLIGASPSLFAEVSGVDRAFYDYFRVFTLHPLSFDETVTCLLELAKQRGDEIIREALEKGQGKLRSIHLLTGGNPRLLKTFYRLLAEGLQKETRQELEMLLDEFTPYFKAIIDALSAQQQKIFDAVALAWDPVEVSSISRQTRLPSNQVSAQLRSMVRAGLLREIPISSKKKTYLLADRFSNIHYLMRHGRVAKARFDWFVAMARLVFEDEDFAKNIAMMAKSSATCGESGWRDACDLVANAAHRADSPSARKHLLDKLAYGGNSDSVVELALLERACRSILASEPTDAHAHYKLGRVFELLHQDYSEAASQYEEALKLDAGHFEAASSLAWNYHRHLRKPKLAEKAYKKALKLDPKSHWVWNNYGSFHQEVTRDFELAEKAFRKAIEMDDKPYCPWFNLGNLYQDFLARPEDAETCYKNSLKARDDYDLARMGLARLYHSQGKEPSIFEPLAKMAALSDIKNGFAFTQFCRLCGDSAQALADVLPGLAKWCAEHPRHLDLPMTLGFTVSFWLRYAALVGTKAAADLLSSQPEECQLPFSILRDVFLAENDKSYLLRLAPERAEVVSEMLKAIRSNKPRNFKSLR